MAPLAGFTGPSRRRSASEAPQSCRPSVGTTRQPGAALTAHERGRGRGRTLTDRRTGGRRRQPAPGRRKLDCERDAALHGRLAAERPGTQRRCRRSVSVGVQLAVVPAPAESDDRAPDHRPGQLPGRLTPG